MIPDPLIFSRPLHIWLGILAFILLILQILVGKRIVKFPFWAHTRIIWVILLIIVLIHAWYGFQIYFLN